MKATSSPYMMKVKFFHKKTAKNNSLMVGLLLNNLTTSRLPHSSVSKSYLRSASYLLFIAETFLP